MPETEILHVENLYIRFVMNAIAPGYDFFICYFTLALTSMIFLSGVSYPITQLPEWLQASSQFLPLSAAVHVVLPGTMT